MAEVVGELDQESGLLELWQQFEKLTSARLRSYNDSFHTKLQKSHVVKAILDGLIRQNSVVKFMQGFHLLHAGPWDFYQENISKAVECRSTHHEFEAELKGLKALQEEMEKLMAQNTPSPAHPDEYFQKLLCLFLLMGGLQTSIQRPRLAWWSLSLVDVLRHIVDKKLNDEGCRHVWKKSPRDQRTILTRCWDITMVFARSAVVSGASPAHGGPESYVTTPQQFKVAWQDEEGFWHLKAHRAVSLENFASDFCELCSLSSSYYSLLLSSPFLFCS